ADQGLTWTNYSMKDFEDADLRGIIKISPVDLFAVGGKLAQDSGFIFHSADNGATWQKTYSANKGKLLRVKNLGGTLIVLGENGQLLRSSNNGLNWTEVSANQNLADISLRDAALLPDGTWLIVGGKAAPDSMQYIGHWISAKDSLMTSQLMAAPSINAMQLFNDSTGYAAGDDGLLLRVRDNGLVWEPINLDVSINDDRDFSSLHFINRYYGAVSGRIGKFLYFRDASAKKPTVMLNAPTSTNKGEVRFVIEAEVFGIQSDLDLIIRSPQGDTTIAVGSTSSQTSSQFQVLATLQEGTYEAEVRLSNAVVGEIYSNTVGFFTGKNEVPNFDFEEWTLSTETVPDQWGVAGKVQVNDLGGSNYEVTLSAMDNQEPGAIYYATPNDNALLGGIAYTGRPDKIWFKGRYSTASGDSVLVIYELKDAAGATVAEGYAAFSGQLTSDTSIGVNVNYQNANAVDTLKLLFVSTNYFGNTINPLSSLTLDSIWFEGTTETVPNQGFSALKTDTIFVPDSWYARDLRSAKFSLYRQSDKVSGRY
ncbi:MAG: hypothetical protein LPK45_07975, partial [Bacteroidota bacterium]|nr:hypothetical protein [Bacteroidota bacterium]MDX5431008.1 hypothetical protein [Bacteroidota bacterium]MDX5469759.1 hypothetical protein [Bacteroidota bacterium]